MILWFQGLNIWYSCFNMSSLDGYSFFSDWSWKITLQRSIIDFFSALLILLFLLFFPSFPSFFLVLFDSSLHLSTSQIGYYWHCEFFFSESNSRQLLAFFNIDNILYVGCVIFPINKEPEESKGFRNIFKDPPNNIDRFKITLFYQETKFFSWVFKIDGKFCSELKKESKKFHFINFCNCMDRVLAPWYRIREFSVEGNFMWDNIKSQFNRRKFPLYGRTDKWENVPVKFGNSPFRFFAFFNLLQERHLRDEMFRTCCLQNQRFLVVLKFFLYVSFESRVPSS